MSFSILSLGGLLVVLRWIHYMSGVMWIGILYYFNFVQGSFMAETDGPTKSQVTLKLLPRALFWFRWGAMGTFVSGVLIFGATFGPGGSAMTHSSWFVAISTGSLLGTLMFLNVWLIIWPKQKIVIANAEAVAKGEQPNPAAAGAAARATLASRTNTVFSIPMLFFMGSASHLGIQVGAESNLWIPAAIILILVGAFEVNAMKGTKLGPLAKPVGFVHIGLALAVVLYVVLELTVK